MTYNIGSALLLLGTGYFYFVYSLNEWIVLGAILLAAGTWARPDRPYPAFTDERKNLYKSRIAYYEAKAEFYKAKATQVRNTNT